MSKALTVFWFRRDLRLDDNVGLFEALNSGNPVLPIFIFDTAILNQLEDESDARVNFIHHSLSAIRTKLQDIGSDLFVGHGRVQDVWKELTEKHSIAAVYANSDYESYARKRDEEVAKLLNENGIAFKTFKDQVIFEKDDVVKDDGDPYTVYTPYMKKWKKTFKTEEFRPLDIDLSKANFSNWENTSFPTLEKIGFKKSKIKVDDPKLGKEVMEHYAERRDIPSEDGTTHLSVHLRFGTIGIRRLVQKVMQKSPVLLNELIWREFFMQILWHFPHVEKGNFRKKYDAVPWRNDESEFQKWCEGKTGYPIVDAGMRELNETGYMHNRVRMITASFLVKHLLIDWRWGEAYFASKLLDYDLSANNGNWQWAAGTGCDAAPYFRVFNPYEQARKFDPKGIYIRKWVPEFDELDYPQPMVEHKMARQRAIDTYKEALN